MSKKAKWLTMSESTNYQSLEILVWDYNWLYYQNNLIGKIFIPVEENDCVISILFNK